MTADHDDFESFASARWPVLVRSGVILGCSLDEAHDLAQTTLLRCFTGWRRVREADDRDAYVYRVLLNCHRDSRRRRWWGEQPTETPPEPEAAPDNGARVASVDAVRRALADLPLIQRQVVVLRHLAQLSEQQTADLLGVAPGTVKSRLSRALAQLATNDHLQDLREGPRA
ncbi:MAG: SigE family RNA polymerase sigma factor [Nocardioides sp.]